MQEFFNLIGGKYQPSHSAATFENVSPANSQDIIGTFPLSGKADIDAAVASAKAAFNAWRLTPAPKRGDILRRAGDIFERRKDELARIMTREMGKPVFETKGDVQEAIDT